MQEARTGRQTGRRGRRALTAIGVTVAAVTVWAVPSQAQTTPPPGPAANFSMAGVNNAGQALAVDKNVTGDFAFCNNLNGLGAELYFDGGDGAGMTVRHASVTPFVVPIHIGLLKVNNPDPDNPVNEEMLTIGVAKGTPIQFGQSGDSSVEFGGVFFGSAAGVVSWKYNANITCTDSKVMPIIQPLIDGGAPPATTPPATTSPAALAPTTIVDTTTTLAPPTTVDTTTTIP